MPNAADGPLLGDVLRAARQQIAGVCEDPSQEVRILAEWAFGLSRLELVTLEREFVAPHRLAMFETALARREKGEPVHRIIGARPFRSLHLALSKDTLEPRADTETLVDLALSHLAGRGGLERPFSILDLGTGTGAIGLALLAELPNATALLTDISTDALATAAQNASANGLKDRAIFQQGSWFDGIEDRFDLVVSNPPYIPTSVIATLDVEVREHDPLAALDGGPDGLAPYRMIATAAPDYLKDDAIIAVEIGHDQAASVTAIFEAAGFRLIELRQDLGGRDRALAFAMR
jgi:release factor glutamine methyltransferase